MNRKRRDPNQPLTPRDAGRLLNVTPDQVRYLNRTGKLPATRLSNGHRIFTLANVLKLARARGIRTEPDAAA
jgi:DNA-binding transcriptional MerR regulator